MKKLMFLIIGLIVLGYSANAYKAAAAFTSTNGNNIQVIIDGKIINHNAKPRVHIIGTAGEHSIKIKIFDVNGNLSSEEEDCIQLQPGYKSFFKLDDKNCSELKTIKIEPYSLRVYKNPDYYYNQKFYACYFNKNTEFILPKNVNINSTV